MAAAVVKPLGPTMQPTQKPVTPTKPREPGASPKRNGRPGTALRVIISLWIVWHFAGVFLAALSIPPTSDLVINIAQGRPMQWYLDALYLNQGHSFFAPEVGPGNLISYEIYDQSGRQMARGELPSRKDQWPRLRYHRHFMLADQTILVPSGEQQSAYWQRKCLESYARHLLRVNEDAHAVRVKRYAHWPLPYAFAAEGMNSVDEDVKQLRERNSTAEADELERNLVKEGLRRGYVTSKREFAREMGSRQIDDQGYELLMEVTQRRSDLGPDDRNQSQMMWQSGGYQTAQPWTGTRR